MPLSVACQQQHPLVTEGKSKLEDCSFSPRKLQQLHRSWSIIGSGTATHLLLPECVFSFPGALFQQTSYNITLYFFEYHTRIETWFVLLVVFCFVCLDDWLGYFALLLLGFLLYYEGIPL